MRRPNRFCIEVKATFILTTSGAGNFTKFGEVCTFSSNAMPNNAHVYSCKASHNQIDRIFLTKKTNRQQKRMQRKSHALPRPVLQGRHLQQAELPTFPLGTLVLEAVCGPCPRCPSVYEYAIYQCCTRLTAPNSLQRDRKFDPCFFSDACLCAREDSSIFACKNIRLLRHTAALQTLLVDQEAALLATTSLPLSARPSILTQPTEMSQSEGQFKTLELSRTARDEIFSPSRL